MLKATIIAKIKNLSESGAEVITDTGKSFLVNCFFDSSFSVNSFVHLNGVLNITAPMGSMTIYELAQIVCGCFEPDSTFVEVKMVEFTFNTVKSEITRQEVLYGPDYVVRKWKKAWDDNLRVKEQNEKFSAYLKEDIDD